MYWYIVDPKGYRKTYKRQYKWRGAYRGGRAQEIGPVTSHSGPAQTPLTYAKLREQYREQVELRQEGQSKREKKEISPPEKETDVDVGLPKEDVLEKADMKALKSAAKSVTGLALDVMAETVSTLLTKDSLHTALEKIYENNLEYLPVIYEEKKVCGLIHKEDLLEQILAKQMSAQDLHKTPVSEFMISPILVCSTDCGLADLVATMLNEQLDYIPVTDSEEQMVGSISWYEICAYLGKNIGLIE